MILRDADILIAGAGPTGLMLAGELALAGVDVAIVERRASQELAGSRAGGLHSRTIEVLDQRGIAERFLSEGQVAQVARFAGTVLDISDFPTRHNYGLGLWQNHIERILAGWVGELAVPIFYGIEVNGFAQDDTGVDVALSNGRSLRAQYLVGCDGGSSLIRKAAGIAFPGSDPTTSNLIAEVEMAETPEWGIHRSAFGVHSFGRKEYQIVDGKIVYADRGPVGVMVTEAHVGPATEPTLVDLSEALIAACGTDYGVHSPIWISRFTDATRQAAAHRKGRVLIAGDAAHVHPPDGGQGLQTGVQDAVNLGWKLAQVVKGISPKACWIATMPSATRWRSACCATRWRRSFFAAKTTARRHCATPCPSCSAWTSRASGSPLTCPAWTFITTSVRDTSCSGAACPIST
jgi:2-polyprenyl-6-methoxyphenol hydroxylase-like FAD-dependent oxidoreductase